MNAKQPIYKAGTTIAGKYRIDKAIARGGCSIVYRGTHVGMDRPVALKIMSLVDGRVDPSWAARFQREAKLASQLRHANTITTFDYGEWNGIFYIIMEWIEGLSLRNLIREQGAVEPQRAARITAQILRSLHEAHSHKILHRDMKPSNIMISNDLDGREVVKVLDFGLAKAQHNEFDEESLKLTRDGDFIGTPRYASPEQLKGEQLTTASDIYGVGMVMWEMLMGEPAVPSVDYGTCIQHHLGPHPWELPPGVVPDGLSLVVERALSKHPSGRYQTCREMLEALDHWFDDLSRAKRNRPTLDQSEAAFLIEQDADLQDFDDLASALDDLDDDLLPMDLIGGPIAKPTPAPAPRQSARPAHRTRQPQLQHKEPSPFVQRDSGILSIDSNSLELDRTVRDPIPPRRNTQPIPSDYHGGNHGGLDRRTIGFLLLGGGGLILVGILVGALLRQPASSENPDENGAERSAGDQMLDDIISGKKPVVPMVEEKKKKKKAADPEQALSDGPLDGQRILLELRSRGWNFQASDPESISGATQRMLRMRRSKSNVNLALYECDDLEFARKLVRDTPAEREVVRIDNITMRLYSSTGSRRGVDALYADLVDIQREALK